MEELSDAGSSRTPFRLACRTRPVWQYRSVPSLSRLLPPTRLISAGGLPPASAVRCDERQAVSFHPRTVSWRLMALEVGNPHEVGRVAKPRAPHEVRRADLRQQRRRRADAFAAAHPPQPPKPPQGGAPRAA